MNKYINIHTHYDRIENQNTFSINNLLIHEPQTIKNNKWYSAGWHPWYIGKNSLNKIEIEIKYFAKNKRVLAIGECGIDRKIDIPIEYQLDVFKLHINIAKRYNKALIVHCVKCYSDLLEILNKELLPITIIHRFSGNMNQVEQLMKYNNIFFSFGAEILKENSKLHNILRTIPISRLFFETDDSDISVEKIYLRASELRNENTEQIKGQISHNFNLIFRNELVKPD
jgi:TatD DNase family protein